MCIRDSEAGRLALDGCGGPVTYRPRRAGGCQLWRFEHVGDGYYRVVDVATGRALASPGSHAAAARWRIEAAAAGGYRLVDGDGYALPTRLDTP